MTMKVHVICCNDGVRYAVVGDEARAEAKMAELKAAYYERNKGCFSDEVEYNLRCFWHIHTVDCETSGAHHD